MIGRVRASLFIVVLSVVFWAPAGPAQADIAPKWSDAQLVGFSEAILTGKVASIASAQDDTGGIYTYVTVDVGDVLKGWVFERQIVVKQLGGRIGDVVLNVNGQPTFVEGEDVLLFLEVRPRDNSLYTVALWQGKWNLEMNAAGQQTAVRLTGGFENRGVLNDMKDTRELGGFLAQLRSLSGPDPTRPNRLLNTRPGEAPAAGTGGVAAPFTFLGPARWQQADSGVPIPIDVQAGGHPQLPGSGYAQLNAARALWTAAGSSFTWSTGNTSAASRCSSTFTGDGRELVTFLDPCGEISNSGSVLAVGGFYSDTPLKTINGQAFETILQGFLVFNDSPSSQTYLNNAGCFQDVATHEIGHSIGFGHSADPNAIMYPTINNGCFSAAHALGADDVSLIRFIYPGAGGTTTAPTAPTNLVASASGSNVTLTWGASTLIAALSAPGAATSYTIEAGSSAGLSNLASFSTGSTATSFSTGGVPNGTFYVRVKGVNAAGTSPSSNEATLVVGGTGCVTPSAPSGLTGSVGGSTVTLVWGAGAGVPTSYVVEAGSASGLANLVIFDTGSAASSLTATGVGPGTYFVRVRSKNGCGISGVSNEFVVIVP